jgi:hypothetical protein
MDAVRKRARAMGIPMTLKRIQESVVRVLRTSSLAAASRKKKSAVSRVRVFHCVGLRLIDSLSIMWMRFFLKP